jgi:hypothetical protein
MTFGTFSPLQQLSGSLLDNVGATRMLVLSACEKFNFGLALVLTGNAMDWR